MAILAGHPYLNRTGAVVGLNVRGEEWREADERGEKGSSSPSMGFSSSPPLCWSGEKRRGEERRGLNIHSHLANCCQKFKNPRLTREGS